MEKVIAYFAKRHFLTNAIVIAVLMGGILAWNHTKKEELPDITFDRVRIQVQYPGATAEDVEYFVTEPIEEVLRGIDGVYRITSHSSVGLSSINVELERGDYGIEEILTEIRSEVFDVELPEEVINDPDIRVFKTSKKAILDIALIDTETHLLDVPSRQKLQKYALTLEDQLLNLPEVNSVTRRGYLQPEIQIKVKPEKLIEYEIPFNTVMQEIKNNHIRKPAGSIETREEPKVTLLSELNTVEKLQKLIVQGGFEGGVVRLGELAQIEEGFEKNENVLKVNGHEAVMLNVVKNSSSGILDALEEVTRVVKGYEKNQLAGTSIRVLFLDDESIDLRNRLSIIGINGGIGFILILITLFLFLNKRSGIWVALGIPFTLCFTLIAGSWMGFTINGTTLAAVIIVMGMIVDDAIVVAENITRMLRQGVDALTAAVKGTSYVLFPVIASILTTCIAFVPLYFFEGRFSAFIQYIPPIIFLVLGASLFESIFILPGHMSFDHPLFERWRSRNKKSTGHKYQHWFDSYEEKYGRLLEKILPYKKVIFVSFFFMLVLSIFIVQTRMKFVMFPNEETREIVLSGEVAAGTKRYDTAGMVKKIEEKIDPFVGKEVIGYRTEIARSRRGGAIEENKFRITMEIVPKEKRNKSADRLIKELEKPIMELEGFRKVSFGKSRWGQDTGKVIEILVKQNDDVLRNEVVQEIIGKMEAHPDFVEIEVDEGFRIPEFRVSISQEMAKRLSISPVDMGSTLRAALEGAILYEFPRGDEEMDVRLTTVDEAKDSMDKILAIPVENQGDYLVLLGKVVSVEEIESPNSIFRQDLKRTTLVDAGLDKKSRLTPLEAAEELEKKIFPEILAHYPTTTISFGGEVQDTRESKSDIGHAVTMVLFLIYVVLAILFNSIWKPLMIMLAIPFGIVGVVFAFWLHGKVLFGFYAAIGVLGLSGVVINDSIIMLTKLDKEYNNEKGDIHPHRQIADIAKTRLRAVTLTTLTTVAGLLPTAYGFAGYDAMLAEMMLALTWGLLFGTLITLVLIPSVFSVEKDIFFRFRKVKTS
ncbi:MAG: efflux RND transporter permease subunit [Candidatus Omnitrophica bacterium]|nr:efflux RND transporter permease subunit [Candidatus Omnitrophota bacterium]